MIRIFQTGDNHIGLNYAHYENGETLAKCRIMTLRDMVQTANEMQCDLFVVTGDLFHSRIGVGKQTVKEVADILAGFEEQVIVLPGNHDYYSTRQYGKDAKNVWSDFNAAIQARNNILLLTEYRPYELSVRDERVVVYPALCMSKHSQPGENNIGWIQAQNIQPDAVYRIGIAHGAVEGRTIDSEGKYFLMSEQVLESIPVDVWLIGHTHVPFPNLNVDTFLENGRIFNAGTHVQTDVSCHTRGNCFLLEIEAGNGQKQVRAKRCVSGSICFSKKEITARADEPLSVLLERELRDLPDKSVLELTLSGSISEEDYQSRGQIINQALSRFLDWNPVNCNALSQLITAEQVKREYAETSFSARLLMELLDNPKEAQMVYDLLKECAS